MGAEAAFESSQRRFNVRARNLHLAGVGGAMFLAGAAAMAAYFGISTGNTGPTDVAMAGLLVVGVFLVLLEIRGPAFVTTLGWLSPVLPAFAAIGTIAVYLGDTMPVGDRALTIGLVIMFMAWFALGATEIDKVRPETAQERAFAELDVRIGQIDGRVHSIVGRTTNESALNETMSTLNAARRTLNGPAGAQWASAIGYVSVGRTVHRAEEALVDLDDGNSVVAGALIDDLRLDGSTIPGRDRLELFLRRAVWELDPAAAALYLPSQSEPGVNPLSGSEVPDIRARSMLREVRRAINDFRDARAEDIVRTRNLLRRTFGFTSLVGFGLLAVAVLSNTPLVVVATATGLFLIAALVGLFARLRNSSVSHSAVDDFGLFEVQLLAGPLVSGIAGLAGVVLVAAAPVAAAALSTVNAPSSSTPTLDFELIFNLAYNPLAVVIAAVFGLTPDLLLRRLEAETEQLKADIQSSYVADKSGRPEGANRQS